MLNSSTEVTATRIRSMGDDNAPAPKTAGASNPSGSAAASTADATPPTVAPAATQDNSAGAAKTSTAPIQTPQITAAPAPAVVASNASALQYDSKSALAIAARDNRPTKPARAAATAAQADSKPQQAPPSTAVVTAPAAPTVAAAVDKSDSRSAVTEPANLPASAQTARTATTAAVPASMPATTAPAAVQAPAPDASQAVAARSYSPPTADANPLAGMPLPNLPSLAGPTPPDAPATNTQIARADVTDLAAGQASAGDQTQLAQAELRKAQDRIGLSDAQVGQLQQAQDKLAAGDSGTAFLLLQELNAQLQTETRSYVVQENESLWHVAGQQEVYGNSYLWPLVWQANKHRVKQPYQLYKGLRLTIPAHPTLQEVSEALAYSKNNSGEGMRPATDPQASTAASAPTTPAPAPATPAAAAPAAPVATPAAEPTSATPGAAPSN
ncbi:MAG: hypothetical protein JWR07_5054 [Nevskia sp.]|nr:hypothetical protein [Nevskia sp.]